jgi:ribosomal protein L11 methyltransferase
LIRYLELSFELEDLEPGTAEAVCWACGASAVTFLDARDDPVLEPAPGEFRLWPRTRLQCLFAPGSDAKGLVRALSKALGLDPDLIAAQEVADRLWEREWLKDFHPRRFGKRLWVCPHHGEVNEPGAVVVALDPGLAFGTGTHPSTALCLVWLDAHLVRESRVIDYGCGSGVLALAAAKLGAAQVHCFDIDPQALTATRANARSNGLGAQLRVHASAGTLPSGADVLLANILSTTLCELAPRFSSLLRPGGDLVLCGLMQHEALDVTRAYAPCFDVVPFAALDGWVCLTGRRGNRQAPGAKHVHSLS